MFRLMRIALAGLLLALIVVAVVTTAWASDGVRPQEGMDGLKPSDLELKRLPMETVPYTNLKIGVTFEWGSFDLGGQPEGMMIVRAQFPMNSKFVRCDLDYYGVYQDASNPAFKGHLFSGNVGGKTRYFLFGIEGGNRRLLVYYRDDGKVLGDYIANVAKQ